jgi:predicted AAA+ superfamily ATPase
MEYIKRILELKPYLDKKSYFLFGARQTGKSTIIRHELSDYKCYDLLDSETYLMLNMNPKRLEQELTKNTKFIIIDEIQKLPTLLDEIHRIIELYGIHFLLTGSSARKLRRGGVNLLGGRARWLSLHPFIYKELKEKFDINKALNSGLLPSIYFSDAPREDLAAYAGIYLKEEIANEGFTRNIPAFSRFLEIAALSNSNIINFTNISNDAQVPLSTVQEYFQILKDTLIAFEVPSWKKTLKRKPISTSKFYFFDVGVARFLQHRYELSLKAPEAGEAFETYIAHELKSYLDYTRSGELFYWRSKSGFEVDFVLNDITGIEVKSGTNVSQKDLKGCKALREEKKLKNFLVVCFEKVPRTVDGINILPWHIFIERLWQGEFI